ncbi:hypothetical protein LZ31DRAFT_283355 [Colletotrichum somersetense]|nr:hypothetical protein LZ31DRAFT_283355 [Colletotrichum somersetense]
MPRTFLFLFPKGCQTRDTEVIPDQQAACHWGGTGMASIGCSPSVYMYAYCGCGCGGDGSHFRPKTQCWVLAFGEASYTFYFSLFFLHSLPSLSAVARRHTKHAKTHWSWEGERERERERDGTVSRHPVPRFEIHIRDSLGPAHHLDSAILGEFLAYVASEGIQVMHARSRVSLFLNNLKIPKGGRSQ